MMVLIFSSCEGGIKSTSKSGEQINVQSVDGIADSEKKFTQKSTHQTLKIDLPGFDSLFKLPDSLALKRLNVIGDFNNDGDNDFASVVLNKKNEKTGVIIWHYNKEIIVFGAGNSVEGMDNLDWIEVLEIIPKGESVAPTVVNDETGDILGVDSIQLFKLIGDGIYMAVEESHGGGVIFWNGKEYQWYHTE